jgi:hypothetical protein
MLFSYILPLPFDSKIEGNYFINTLWRYLKGLLEAPNIVKYVGTNPTWVKLIRTIKAALERKLTLCLVSE